MSDEPKWLSRAELERIHVKVIEAAGGSHGLRDADILESALARPQNLHAYGETDTFQLAASYAEGIARTQAFVDGNKRTAWTAADVFLRKHGQAMVTCHDDQHANMIDSLAQGKLSREEAATYLKENSRSIEQERSGETRVDEGRAKDRGRPTRRKHQERKRGQER